MNEVSSSEDLPQSSWHVYHVTDRRNLDSILATGIDPTMKRKQWDGVNEFLHLVAEDAGMDVGPKDRSQCVFAYPRFSDAVGYDSGSNVVLAVDLGNVSAELYRASYHTATEVNDVLENKSLMSADEILSSRELDSTAENAYQTAIEYWESLSIESPPINKGGELLIDGPVPAGAITHYTT